MAKSVNERIVEKEKKLSLNKEKIAALQNENKELEIEIQELKKVELHGMINELNIPLEAVTELLKSPDIQSRLAAFAKNEEK